MVVWEEHSGLVFTKMIKNLLTLIHLVDLVITFYLSNNQNQSLFFVLKITLSKVEYVVCIAYTFSME